MNSSLKVFVKTKQKKKNKNQKIKNSFHIATPRKTRLKGIESTVAGSLPAAKERCQGEERGGPCCGLGGAGILDDIFWVDLVLLEDHEDGGVGHAVHAAVVEDAAKALLGRRADEGGVASDELPHQHPGQEHRVGLGVRFAVVVGIRGVSGKVAPCNDTHELSWVPGVGGSPQLGRGGSGVLSIRRCPCLPVLPLLPFLQPLPS